MSKIDQKSSQLEETSFYEKPCFPLVKPMIFSFEALRKSMIFQPKTRRRKTERSETRNFIGFRTIFGPKIDQTSDAERSLFCDAMELTRNSSEVSPPWSFWTIYLVTHMIRSGLSIDLLLVALIISTSVSEGHAT